MLKNGQRNARGHERVTGALRVQVSDFMALGLWLLCLQHTTTLTLHSLVSHAETTRGTTTGSCMEALG